MKTLMSHNFMETDYVEEHDAMNIDPCFEEKCLPVIEVYLGNLE